MKNWLLKKHTGTPFWGTRIEQLSVFGGNSFTEVKAQIGTILKDLDWKSEGGSNKDFYTVDENQPHVGYTITQITGE